jgi:transcription initiation factor TFIID subunit 7
MGSKRKKAVISGPAATSSPSTILRLRRNSEGEWRVVPRNESSGQVVRFVVPRASNSPQAAEDAIGSNDARTSSPATPKKPVRNPLRTPSSVPLAGGLANNGTPEHGEVQRDTSVSKAVLPKSILKRTESLSLSQDSPTPSKSPEKTVGFVKEPQVKIISPLRDSPSPPENEQDIIAPASFPKPDHMAEPQRPKLKLSLKNTGNIQQDAGSTPASAMRTPSIKLNFGKKPLPTPVVKPEPTNTPGSTTKKRKRTQKAIEADTPISSEDEGTPFKKPDPPLRRITLKQPSKPATQAQTPTSGLPNIKLKYKGKLPRRPIGVGYDSENEDTEKDPVILDGFILRMQPGPDSEYLRKAIAEGTVGMPRASGGADIQVRFFDTHGRRGVVVVRQQRYASCMVDLPCVVEGMKSWDRKGWIKSIDVCQMLLVLGRCNTDDEARGFPLPPDIDQKTWQYAHGLTVPMRWVRKRRFNRTKRARVDDIEAVERRVKALLDGDDMADTSSYTLHDHDPREDNEPGEESGEYESESAEEEVDVVGTPGDYFAAQNGQAHRVDSPLDDVDEDALLQTFEDDDADDSRLPAPQFEHSKSTLHPPEDASSFAVTSTSGSPSAAAPTPVSAEDSGDEEEDDDDEEDESADEAEEEGDENRQQALDRIADMKKKIKEQMEVMRGTENAILRKKIAGKIAGLRGDEEQMRRAAGLEEEDEEED